MLPTSRLSIFFTIFALFYSTFYCANARVTCNNDRACPDNYECDSNGKFCCQNSSCPLRSAWSLSTTECLVSGGSCPLHMFCHENGNHCTEKEILHCDLYLNAEKIVACGAEGYPLKSGFTTCSRMFYGRPGVSHQVHTTVLCTAHCLQHWMSDLLYKKEHDCSRIKEKMSGYEVECLVECEFCRLSSSWDFYFNLFQLANRSESLVRSLALKCAEKYQHERSATFQRSIVEKAQKLHNYIKEQSGVLVDNESNELLKTTTATPSEITPVIELESTVKTSVETISELSVETTFEPTEYLNLTATKESTTISPHIQPFEIHYNTPTCLNTSTHRFYLGLNWPSAFFAFAVLITGAVCGFFVSYLCCPRTVYNVESI